MSDELLYLATGDGVYEARDGDARLLGLAGKGAIRWLLVDVDDRKRLYAATGREGVWRSEDSGANWHEANNGLTEAQAFSLAQHPVTKDLYVGTEPAAIFRSTDRGESWTELEALSHLPGREVWTFPNPPHVAHVKGMSLAEADPELIFGAVEVGWIVRSRDGGESWDNIREGPDFDSHTVLALPPDQRIVVSTSGKGVYRSTDGGDRFEDANDGITHRYLAHVAGHRTRPEVLFTAGAAVPPSQWRRPGGAGAEFYRSEDAGRSWQRLTGGLPERIEAAPRAVACDPADADVLYVGMQDGAVWRSDDCGDSFARILAGLPPVFGVCPVHA